MIKFKNLLEKSGAGDWGTDEARKTLQKDTPKQGITQIGEKNKCRKESVELDELDSKTYRSYIDKAQQDQINRMQKKKQTDKDKQTMRRRSLGIATAQGKQYGDKRSISQRIRGEEVELDEGTLAAKDSNVVDTILDALRIKLIADLEKGDVKNAQEIAKLVKMSIEKDYKHKGYSRLKR